MWRGTAGIASIVLLTLAGCATGVGSPPVEVENNGKACYHGHRPPSTVAVVIYMDAAGTVQVVPETIVVEHPNQTVIWTAADGEISDMVFERSDCAPGPPSINRKGKQLSTRIAAGHRGTHKYSFTFHPTDGEAERIDPLIVVEY